MSRRSTRGTSTIQPVIADTEVKQQTTNKKSNKCKKVDEQFDAAVSTSVDPLLYSTTVDPPTPHYMDEFIDSIVLRIRTIVSTGCINYTRISNDMGISGGTLSLILNNKYTFKNTITSIQYKIRQWLYRYDLYIINDIIKKYMETQQFKQYMDNNHITDQQLIEYSDMQLGFSTRIQLDKLLLSQLISYDNQFNQSITTDNNSANDIKNQFNSTKQQKLSSSPPVRVQRRASKQANKKLKHVNNTMDNSSNNDNVVHDSDIEHVSSSDDSERNTNSLSDSSNDDDGDDTMGNTTTSKRKPYTRHKSPGKKIFMATDLYNVPINPINATRDYTPLFTSDYWQCNHKLQYDTQYNTDQLVMNNYSTVSFINDGKQINLQLYQTKQLQSSKCITANCGGPVNCVAWCPVGNHTTTPLQCDQYCAVTVFNNKQYHNITQQYTTGTHCIQLWNCGCLNSKQHSMKLDLIIYINNNTIFDMKWLSNGCVWQLDNRLGILAVALGDGTVRLISVPYINNTTTRYININNLPHINLLCRYTLSNCYSLTLAWNNSIAQPMLAVGSSTQHVAIFDLTNIALHNHTVQSLQSTLQFTVCNQLNRITSMVWSPVNLFHIAISTTVPNIQIYDIRSIKQSIFTIDTYKSTCKSMYWLSTQPDIILTAVGSHIRLYPLIQPYDRHNDHYQNYHTLSVPGERSIPLDDITYCNDITITSQLTNNDIWCIATAMNNGTCNVIAQSWDTIVAEHEKYRSHIILSLQSSNDDTMNKCILHPQYKIQSNTKKNESTKLRQITAQQLDYLSNSRDILLSDTISINTVSINPNISYPRMLMSGTASGLCQLFVLTNI